MAASYLRLDEQERGARSNENNFQDHPECGGTSLLGIPRFVGANRPQLGTEHGLFDRLARDVPEC